MRFFKLFVIALCLAAFGVGSTAVATVTQTVIDADSDNRIDDNMLDAAYDNTGLLKADGAGDITTAVAGTDYQGHDDDLDTLASPTANRLFYSDSSGVVSEITIGASGEVLKSQGVSAAPQFAAESGLTDLDDLPGDVADNDLIDQDLVAGLSQQSTAGILKLFEASANGTNFLGWKAPDTLSDDVTYVATDTNPTNGQVMLFSAPSGGESSQTWGTPVLKTQSQIVSVTIFDPDTIYNTDPNIPLLPVESDWAPNGITIVSCGIKTSPSSTYSVPFKEFTSPADGSPSTIETVATSASTEAEDDGSLTDSAIAVGSIVYATLPATDINMLVVWFTYTVN